MDTLFVSFDGSSWQALDSENRTVNLLADENNGVLPLLPENAVVSRLILPVELLLSRIFSLPLSSPRFIDREILTQELEEHSSEAADAWWLAWQAAQSDNGVSGIMFGLPEDFRRTIEENENWRQLQELVPDIWVRLNRCLHEHRAEWTADMQADAPVAVLDADVDGMFLGVWNGKGQSENGFWQGMRRLNVDWSVLSTPDLEEQYAELVENINRTLHAMGWQHENGMAMGRVHSQLHMALDFSLWQGDISELSDLPTRHEGNLADLSACTLNFRHGRWNSKSQLAQLKPWYRSLALAAALAVIWISGIVWQNYQLNSQLETHQQRITDAFHNGLPEEKVLIDALAQLRKAAGSGAVGEKQRTVALWMQHLAGINRVYQKTPWKIRELSFHNGKMTLSGEAKDLQLMNRIREALQQETGRNVKLEDTDLQGNQVRFRMVWS